MNDADVALPTTAVGVGATAKDARPSVDGNYLGRVRTSGYADDLALDIALKGGAEIFHGGTLGFGFVGRGRDGPAGRRG